MYIEYIWCGTEIIISMTLCIISFDKGLMIDYSSVISCTWNPSCFTEKSPYCVSCKVFETKSIFWRCPDNTCTYIYSQRNNSMYGVNLISLYRVCYKEPNVYIEIVVMLI